MNRQPLPINTITINNIPRFIYGNHIIIGKNYIPINTKDKNGTSTKCTKSINSTRS